MLMAHPTVLLDLVERYELLDSAADGTDPRIAGQLRDTAYTLCVSTGTRDITEALTVARAHIVAADGAADGAAA
ncbi:DUF5133 domain-containing protein [Streptomyces sp. NPDC021020]|uniref:DUF5133 domain-containing protein n=1 Tax=Streptomyces sp. NPDC021020 TaxID=3365109 RepID=UPI0037BD263D